MTSAGYKADVNEALNSVGRNHVALLSAVGLKSTGASHEPMSAFDSLLKEGREYVLAKRKKSTRMPLPPE